MAVTSRTISQGRVSGRSLVEEEEEGDWLEVFDLDFLEDDNRGRVVRP